MKRVSSVSRTSYLEQDTQQQRPESYDLVWRRILLVVHSISTEIELHRNRLHQRSSSWNRACLQTNHIEMDRTDSGRQRKTCSQQRVFIIWGGPETLEKSVHDRENTEQRQRRESARRILWGENGVPDRDTNFQDNSLRLIVVNEEDRIF